MKTSIVMVLLLVILSLVVLGCRGGPVPAPEPEEVTELTQSTDEVEQLGEDLDVGTDWSEFEDLELG